MHTQKSLFPLDDFQIHHYVRRGFVFFRHKTRIFRLGRTVEPCVPVCANTLNSICGPELILSLRLSLSHSFSLSPFMSVLSFAAFIFLTFFIYFLFLCVTLTSSSVVETAFVRTCTTRYSR